MVNEISLLTRLLSMSEERFGMAVGDLLSSDRFLGAVERAIASGAAARGAVEKGVAQLLKTLNVPTLDDLTRLERKLEELEELIGATSEEVDRLESAVGPPAPRRRRKRSATAKGDRRA